MEGVLASLRCLFRQTGERTAQTCAKAIFRHLPTERKEISGEYPIDSLAGCAKKGIPKTRRTEGRNLQGFLPIPHIQPLSRSSVNASVPHRRRGVRPVVTRARPPGVLVGAGAARAGRRRARRSARQPDLGARHAVAVRLACVPDHILSGPGLPCGAQVRTVFCLRLVESACDVCRHLCVRGITPFCYTPP